MRLANVTMHPQDDYLDAFKALGYVVNPEPLLRVCAGAEDAKAAAVEALKAAEAQGAQGILLGGRTDVVIYAAILAAIGNFKVFVAETERIRDANDAFVFNLAGVTPVELNVIMERDEQCLGVGVRGVPYAPAHYETPADEYALEFFQSGVKREGAETAAGYVLGCPAEENYTARIVGDRLVVSGPDGDEIGSVDILTGAIVEISSRFKVRHAAKFGPRCFYAVGQTGSGKLWFGWGANNQDFEWEMIVSDAEEQTEQPCAREGAVVGDLEQVSAALRATMGALALNFHDSDEPDVVAGVKEMHARLQKALIARP